MQKYSPPDPRDVLRKAAERITEEGKWTRGKMWEHDNLRAAHGNDNLRGHSVISASEYDEAACALGTIDIVSVRLAGAEEANDARRKAANRAAREASQRLGRRLATDPSNATALMDAARMEPANADGWVAAVNDLSHTPDRIAEAMRYVADHWDEI